MPRFSGKCDDAIEGPQHRQHLQEFSFRIAQRDQSRNKLTEQACQKQTDGERGHQSERTRGKPAQRNESNEYRKRDEQNLNRRRYGETESRSVLENLPEKGSIARVRMLFSLSSEPAKSDVAQLAERHVDTGEKSERQKQQQADGYSNFHTDEWSKW